MFPRWWRLGIRPQLTLIVILGAILSTFATLFIANNAIQNYVLEQARSQEADNMKIARLVLQTRYGPNVSISYDGKMVVDLPSGGQVVPISPGNNFGRYVLNSDTDFVNAVQSLVGGDVSIYQCAGLNGVSQCERISTTIKKPGGGDGVNDRALNTPLDPCVQSADRMNIAHNQPREWLGVDCSAGPAYFADYSPMFNPQGQLIGVMYVGVPLATITQLEQQTTLELVIIGSIIMIAGIIFALFFSNAIITTLQRAARQVSGASERMGGIAAQQSSGAAQQVWAINAINQALQNFSETAKDISHRTDQLALMGNQVLQRRQEISPAQIDSILAYITRSVRDISVASKQQAVQYERMTGAMQAVIEIAEQVAGNSQASSESSERLELVVRQLRQLVGVRAANRRGTSTDQSAVEAMTQMGVAAAPNTGPTSQGQMRGARRRGGVARGPATGGRSGGMSGPNMGGAGMMAGRGSASGMGNMGGMGNPGMSSAGMMAPYPGEMSGYDRQGMGMGMGAPAMGGMGGLPAIGGMGGMGGAANGGRMGGVGNRGMIPPPPNGQGPDWRLPPLPEMPEPPDWPGRMSGPSSRQDYDGGVARPSRDRNVPDGWSRG
ncbi:MAG TPA: methyl-accepting chemotaxis protein [Ktedonobacterales bacterium]